MKKLIFGLTAIVIVITGIFAFAGCEKEESTETNSIKNVQKTAYAEVVNPDESELLNRTYTVAIYDGEQFHLTFDPDLFLHNLEDYLNSHSGEQYVAEDVSIIQTVDFDEPFLVVSFFDINNDNSSKLYFALVSEGFYDIGIGYDIPMPDERTTVKCKSNANCNRNIFGPYPENEWGCRPKPNGCTPCPNPNGVCNSEITTTYELAAVCTALSNSL